MAEVYSSLYKGNVHITTIFKPTHKALDLGNYKTRNPIYSPNKLGGGKVSYIATSYKDSNGKLWNNSLSVYIKYDNGMSSRHFHGEVGDKVVSVGDRVVAGQQVYRTGNTGASNGDHLHYVLTDKNGTPIDPAPWVTNDQIELLKVGQKLEFVELMNIRDSANGKDIGDITKGAVGEIIAVSTFTGGYQWYQVKFGDVTGFVADTEFNKVTTKAITNINGSAVVVVPPPPELTCAQKLENAQKSITTLEVENKTLSEALATSQAKSTLLQDRVDKVESDLAVCNQMIKDLEGDVLRLTEELGRVTVDRNRFEEEKLELQRKLDELEQGRDSWIKRLGDILHKLFKGE